MVDVGHADGGIEDAPLVHSIEHKAPDTLVNLHKGALLSASPRSASHPSHFQRSQKIFPKGFRLDWPAAGMDKDHVMNTMSNCLAQDFSTAQLHTFVCTHQVCSTSPTQIGTEYKGHSSLRKPKVVVHKNPPWDPSSGCYFHTGFWNVEKRVVETGSNEGDLCRAGTQKLARSPCSFWLV